MTIGVLEIGAIIVWTSIVLWKKKPKNQLIDLVAVLAIVNPIAILFAYSVSLLYFIQALISIAFVLIVIGYFFHWLRK